MANINVHTDYDWTSVPRKSPLRDDAPHVYLYSYKITSSAALNRINSYISLLKKGEDVDGFYDNLYQNTEQKDVFILPYFGDNVRGFNNEFGDTFQYSALGALDSILNTGSNEIGALLGEMSVLGNAKQVMGNMTQIGGGLKNNIANGAGFSKIKNDLQSGLSNMGSGTSTAPGSYIETPKLYQYAQNDNSLDVRFPLFNTINSDSISKNDDLIKKLTTINRPKRLTAITMESPYIYEVKLPGLRYMRWAYCSQFSVNLLGARRIVNGKIIPDGYEVSMSLTSLTTEVNNFMDKV